MAGAAKDTPEEEYRLSICSKLCYAIGGAPNQVAGSAAAFFLQIYLLDIAHITPFHASLVLFIGKASGAVTDPVAGFFISKSRWTKIGRLMPWMMACTPFTVVSYFFMWYLPPFVSGRVAWYLTFYCLFQALTTLFQVPYSALTMFLSTDQKERDSATAYRMTMEVLGTLIGAALQGQIVASAHVSHHCTVNPPGNTTDSWHHPPSSPDPSDPLSHQAKVYMIAAGVIGGVYLLGIVILFLGVKEKDDPYALNSDRAIPFCKGLGLTMKHGPYVKLTASFLLISTAVQLEQSNFVLFCTHAADLRNHFQYLVVTILWMIPFAVMLVTIPNLILAYLVAFVSGLSIAASLLLPWSMLPDVVDNFRLQNPHGKGHETIFYSSYVFFTKMSAGIGLGISAAGLEFTGYKPGICRQSNDVILTLKILIGAVPAVLILAGLFILLFYPITEESRKETKLALEELRRSHQSTENLDEHKEDTSV
ncbi:sphingosine-1-phosphate transporter MFSD2B isoform X2 [Columba livia]|uniref:sphingosine-1-phosphate transporter MFSD2B isoform X2 n=1 Tax=Columba livia TaxID=8932 RepID=UPI0031BB11C8